VVSASGGGESRRGGRSPSGNKGSTGGASSKTPPRGAAATPQRGARAQPTRSHRKSAPNPKMFVALVILLVIVGGGALAFIAGRNKGPVATTVDPNLPPAVAKGYALGRPNAPVQIIEFADFECPACGTYAVVTEPDVRKRIIDSGYAQVTYYDFPLPQHKNTWVASEAAACASDQGKFWEMHDRLFQGQGDWNGETTSDPAKVMKSYAKDIGLDIDRWQQCVDQRSHQRDIQANKAEGERHHVIETPTFVIGNRQVPGAISYDEMRAYVDSARGTGAARTTAAR
jgi:protein-disulfide isomerase